MPTDPITAGHTKSAVRRVADLAQRAAVSRL